MAVSPARIEEVVAKVQKQLEEEIMETENAPVSIWAYTDSMWS